MPDLHPPRCSICRDAGWLRTESARERSLGFAAHEAPGPIATAVKCVCQRRSEPERTERSCPPANVVPLRDGRRRG